MPEVSGSNVETLEAAGHAGFFVTGAAAVGEFNCRECSYGVIVRRELPLCPMCGGTSWEPSEWRPFTRFSDPQLR